MQNRFKLRISRMFRSSFGSCRTRKISDVIEKPVFTTQSHNNASLFNPSPSPPPPPKARPFPSICKPKRHESTQSAINHDCLMIKPRETVPRRKALALYPPFVVSGSGSAFGFDGRKCPTGIGTNPLSPLNLFSDCKDFGFYEKKKKSIARHKTKKKKKRVATFFSSSSQESANHFYSNNHSGRWWFSSEDETETLFSWRDLSSDSSDSLTARHHRRLSDRKRSKKSRRRRAKNRSCDMGFFPLEATDKDEDNNLQVRDSFAVVKRSSDPYNDFRTSMLEMIVERQMFGCEDLEHLLQCFLSLNSPHHHRIIMEVFTEIWETLFCNWS